MIHFKIILSFLLCSQFFLAQDRKIYGVVKDSTGSVLPGVNILVEGKQTYTTTDFYGNYNIKANSADFLIFSYVGMKSKKISANPEEINVTLQADAIIEDLIPPVIQQKKPKYAISRVSEEDLKNGNNPYYNFSKNAKNNLFVIFISSFNGLQKEDFDFQQKYKILYSGPGSYPAKYLNKYNKLTFEYLTRKYKKDWLSEVRQDAIGLKKYSN